MSDPRDTEIATLRAALAEAQQEANIRTEQRDEAEAERDALQAEVAMLRGEGCGDGGDGPCGACLKCYKAGTVPAVSSLREENALLRAEVERLKQRHSEAQDIVDTACETLKTYAQEGEDIGDAIVRLWNERMDLRDACRVHERERADLHARFVQSIQDNGIIADALVVARAEVERLRAEREAARFDLALVKEDEKRATLARWKAEHERDEARKSIDAAPHMPWCRVSPCTCWKSRALATTPAPTEDPHG